MLLQTIGLLTPHCLGLFIKFEPWITAQIVARPLWIQLGLALLGPALLSLIHPDTGTILLASALSGLSFGAIFERQKVDYQITGSFIQRLIRFGIGTRNPN